MVKQWHSLPTRGNFMARFPSWKLGKEWSQTHAVSAMIYNFSRLFGLNGWLLSWSPLGSDTLGSSSVITGVSYCNPPRYPWFTSQHGSLKWVFQVSVWVRFQYASVYQVEVCHTRKYPLKKSIIPISSHEFEEPQETWVQGSQSTIVFKEGLDRNLRLIVTYNKI